MKLLNNWKLVLLLCLTLGLAPYFPEPHLWGKLKWVAGGASWNGFYGLVRSLSARHAIFFIAYD